MKHFKNIITILSGLSMVLLIFFGVNLATSVNSVKSVFRIPSKMENMHSIDSQLLYHVHELEHANELMWELARLMTDDPDQIIYAITYKDGVPYTIDIRQTAEGVELAFMFKKYIVYPLHYSAADRRKYIVIHDYHSGTSENYYLYEIN